MVDQRPWEDGDILFATDLRYEFDDAYRTSLYNLFEADVDGLSFMSATSIENVYYGTKTTNVDTATQTGFSDGLDAASDCVYAATTVDECSDSSVDVNIWTTSGAVTENTEYLEVITGSASNSDYATADQVNGIDYRNQTDDCVAMFKINRVVTNRNGNFGTASIFITDTNGDTLLKAYGSAADGTTTYFVKIFFNKGAQTCDIYIDGTLATANIDLSTNSTNWFLKFHTIQDGSAQGSMTTAWRLYYLRDIVGDGNSKTYQTDMSTADSTIETGTVYHLGSAGGGSIAWTQSADNGGNYEASTEGEQHIFTNTGTQWIGKATLTEPTAIDVSSSIDVIPYIKAFGVRQVN